MNNVKKINPFTTLTWKFVKHVIKQFLFGTKLPKNAKIYQRIKPRSALKLRILLSLLTRRKIRLPKLHQMLLHLQTRHKTKRIRHPLLMSLHQQTRLKIKLLKKLPISLKLLIKQKIKRILKLTVIKKSHFIIM